MSDMIILYSIVVLFIGLGVLMPFVNDAFGEVYSTPDVEQFEDDLISDTDSATALNIWTILKSVFLMFIWTFGQVPLVIDALVLMPLRIIGVLTVARNIWVGGGG